MSHAQHADTRRQRYAPRLHDVATRPLAPGWHEDTSTFHNECGFLWGLHDNRIAGRPLPWGCPSEAEARSAFGDR